MKKFNYIFISLALVAIGLFLYNSWSKSQDEETNQRTAISGSGESRQTSVALETKTVEQGGITVTVTPKNVSNESSTWDFAISLDTHSGSLDQDLVEVAELVVDSQTYRPVQWEGDPVGGHHRTGDLRFGAPSKQSKTIILKIEDVGGTEPAIFQWDL